MRDIVNELVETRINGNSIRGNKTYEKMLKRVTFKEIASYASWVGCSWSYDDIGKTQKLDLIEIIRNSIDEQNRKDY